MCYPPCETAFFFTIPIVLKTIGSSSGQDAAVTASKVATVISTMVDRASGRPVLRRCQPIHD
jgi:hypothetical protein